MEMIKAAPGEILEEKYKHLLKTHRLTWFNKPAKATKLPWEMQAGDNDYKAKQHHENFQAYRSSVNAWVEEYA